MNVLKRAAPALVLLFLAPIIGELLSGSAPPAEFFHPFGLITLSLLYGVGAILIREMTVRWGKGWPTVIMLGAAYGIAEEGLIVASFSNPGWMDLGNLAWYGRWLGVNWVWAVFLTIYHTLVSISVPILLVELLFPARRSRPWVGRKMFAALVAVWLLNGVFIFGVMMDWMNYSPPPVPYLLTLALFIVLIPLARRLPAPTPLPPTHEVHKGRTFHLWLIGLVTIAAEFIISGGGPEWGLPPLITIFLLLAIVALGGWLALRVGGGIVRVSERHQLALAAGVLTWFVMLAPLQEMDSTRPDNTTGMALVGLVMLAFLLWLGRRVWRRTRWGEV